jgi:hypothetical protein
MAELLPEYPVVGGRIALVRYDRTSEATAFFSSQCNVRVIWGGDATIATIRKQEIPPRAFDVCFADRYSLAVLRSSEVLKLDGAGLAKLAEAFYNDTYLFDQNACSAPHLVCWLGDSAGGHREHEVSDAGAFRLIGSGAGGFRAGEPADGTGSPGPHRGYHRVLADMGRMGSGEDAEPEGDGEGMK